MAEFDRISKRYGATWTAGANRWTIDRIKNQLKLRNSTIKRNRYGALARI
jgi:hypothetical protein